MNAIPITIIRFVTLNMEICGTVQIERHSRGSTSRTTLSLVRLSDSRLGRGSIYEFKGWGISATEIVQNLETSIHEVGKRTFIK